MMERILVSNAVNIVIHGNYAAKRIDLAVACVGFQALLLYAFEPERMKSQRMLSLDLV